MRSGPDVEERSLAWADAVKAGRTTRSRREWIADPPEVAARIDERTRPYREAAEAAAPILRVYEAIGEALVRPSVAVYLSRRRSARARGLTVGERSVRS